MTINEISKFDLIKPILESHQGKQIKQTGGTKEQPGFGQMLTDAIKEVDAAQKDADVKIEGLMLGKAITPHSAMIALEKADIAFQLLTQVKSKIVQAYQEVLRTQI